MSISGMDLAKASWNAVKSIVEERVPHPPTYVNAVLDFLRFLRRDRGASVPATISRAEYEGWRNEAASSRTMARPSDLDGFLIDRYYRLFTVKPLDQLEFTNDEDMENDLFFSGRRIVDVTDDVLLKRRLTWNYVLLFPEVFNVLQLFPSSGQKKNAVGAREGSFIFCRKLNSVVCDTLFEEALTLGLLERVEASEQMHRVGAVPLPVRATLAVESYLQLSEHRLDVSIPRREVEDHLAFVLPGMKIDLNWQLELRRSGPVLQLEVGGARLRLTPEDFVWLVQRRLVAPVDVGRVLVRQNEGAAATWLLKQYESRLNQLSPIANLDEFRSSFT
jgi:hypothetical protein